MHIREMTLMSDTNDNKPMTAEERMSLIMRPFPIVRVNTSKGNSQAPRWAKHRLDRENRETFNELE